LMRVFRRWFALSAWGIHHHNRMMTCKMRKKPYNEVSDFGY
jgi:hypothetical protein